MTVYFFNFRQWPAKRLAIRVTFAVPALTQQEARTIAAKEAERLSGYRYQGVN